MTLDSVYPQGGFDAAEMWLSALRAAGRSPSTLANYTHAVGKLAAWRGDRDITTVSRFEAVRFVQHLTDEYAPGGVSNRVRSLRACFSWLLAEEIVESNPLARIKISVLEEAKTTADDEQIDRMLAHAKGNRRDLALLTLLVDSGARKREIAAVTVADLDLTSGTVRFPVSKTVIRTVPLTDRAVVALGRWLRERGTGAGSLWSVQDPYQLVRQVVRRHSKGTLTPHSLRRAFAVRWLARGGSETGLMRVAGWSSLVMVQTYVRAQSDVLAADEMRRIMS
jgi:integrase